MISDKVHLLFRIRIRIHNLPNRILQKVLDPYGSGSTTLVKAVYLRPLFCFWYVGTVIITEKVSGKKVKMRKEWGFFSTYYTYITVFIRNAANLTLLLLKGSKLRKGNKN
jgi:hypothetical protein